MPTPDRKAVTVKDIAQDIDKYEYRIRSLVLTPEIEVLKDGKLMNIIIPANIQKFSGQVDPEYAEKLFQELINDFKTAFPMAYAEKAVAQQNNQRSE